MRQFSKKVLLGISGITLLEKIQLVPQLQHVPHSRLRVGPVDTEKCGLFCLPKSGGRNVHLCATDCVTELLLGTLCLSHFMITPTPFGRHHPPQVTAEQTEA